MQGIKKEILIGRNLAKKLLPLVLGSWLLMSFGLPGIYFTLGSRDLGQHAALAVFILFEVLGLGLAGVIYLYSVRRGKNMEGQLAGLIAAIQNSSTECACLRAAAQESEQRFRDLLQGLEAVVWEADASTLTFSFLSRSADGILGYPFERWLEPGFWADHIHPHDREDTLALLRSIKEEGKAYEVEYRMIASDRRTVWIHDQVRLSAGLKPPGRQLRGQMVDITERKRVADALAEEKNLLAVTLRSIQDGVITTDTNGRIILMNEAAEQFTGWSKHEVIGKNLNAIFRVLDEGTGRGIGVSFERAAKEGAYSRDVNPKILLTRDKTERVIEEIMTPMYNGEGNAVGMVVVFRDITDKRRTEEELLKIRKLESIGLLAGGIAHDFNNILTALMGNLSLAKMYSSQEKMALERLDDAEKACLRAQDLTAQLLTFSKGGSPIKKLASIARIVKESANFALRGSPVSCKFFIAEDLLPAEVDVGQISQVFNNIIINAAQAMPTGGIIEIFAENVPIEKTAGLPLTAQPYVKISVRDYGIGIPGDYLQKIFDPYFTTKQKGSGLGLATTYSIINKHNGCITVESKLGIGATFHIHLPASDKVLSDTGDQGKRLFAGKGRILVMDDEDIIRLIVGTMLEELGYYAEFVEEGEKAVERYKSALQSGRPFDAVLIDLTIRVGMGGTECIKQLLAVDPGVRAILSTGYSDDPVISNYRELGFRGVITKPYRIEDISEILYKTIHGVTRYYEI